MSDVVGANRLTTDCSDETNQFALLNPSEQFVFQHHRTSLLRTDSDITYVRYGFIHQSPNNLCSISDCNYLLRNEVHWTTTNNLLLGSMPMQCMPTVEELYQKVRLPLYSNFTEKPKFIANRVHTYILKESKRHYFNQYLEKLTNDGKVVEYADLLVKGNNNNIDGHEYVLAPLQSDDADTVCKFMKYPKTMNPYIRTCIMSKYLPSIGLYRNLLYGKKHTDSSKLQLVASILVHASDLAIGGLGVDKSCRRKGIGTLLVNKMANILFEKGMLKLRANIVVDNKASELMFTNCGFEAIPGEYGFIHFKSLNRRSKL